MIHTNSLCLPHLGTPAVFPSHLSAWGLFSKCISRLRMAQNRKLWTLQGKTSQLPFLLSYKAMFSGADSWPICWHSLLKNDAEIKSYLCERDIWTSRIEFVLFQPLRSSGFKTTSLLSHAFFFFFQQDDLNWVPATSSGKILWINQSKDSKFSIHLKPKIMQHWILKGPLCRKANLYFSSQ